VEELELTHQELLELTAVAAGLKPAHRLERPATIGQRLAEQLTQQGFVCVVGNFHLVTHHRHPLGDTFVRLASGSARGMQRGTYYVATRSRAIDAEALAHIEATDPGSPEIGRRLGYPPCCITAYEEIHRGHDWIAVMLRRSSTGEPGLTPCNRLARLFGEWALLPDYFPCSFSCRTSAAWAEEIARAASERGLRKYIEAAKSALAIPIDVEEDTITRLDQPYQVVRHKTGLNKPRRLTWIS
jgi:hypothetical protein